jgi:hypothetical protein
MFNRRMRELSIVIGLRGAVDMQHVFPETSSIGTQQDVSSYTQSQFPIDSRLPEGLMSANIRTEGRSHPHCMYDV